MTETGPAEDEIVTASDAEGTAGAEGSGGAVAIGVDVGGSGIKAAAVDTARGVLVSERLRVPTPEPSTPAAVIASIFRIVRRVERSIGAANLPVGIDFPSVILDGRTMTAANVDKAWIQYAAVEHLERAMGRPVSLINDADAAGLAEMRFGAGAGHPGVVLVLTLGTGVGSALFVDGVLVPNTELGHMEIRGRDAERRSAAAARVRRGLSWKAWTEDLDEHLIAIDRILWPDLIVLGGGVSKNADRFIPRLTCRPPVVPAVLRNEAGMVGAAMVAVERGGAAAAAYAAAFRLSSAPGLDQGVIAEDEQAPGSASAVPVVEVEPEAEQTIDVGPGEVVEGTFEPGAEMERETVGADAGVVTDTDVVTVAEIADVPTDDAVIEGEAVEIPAEADVAETPTGAEVGETAPEAEVDETAPEAEVGETATEAEPADETTDDRERSHEG